MGGRGRKGGRGRMGGGVATAPLVLTCAVAVLACAVAVGDGLEAVPLQAQQQQTLPQRLQASIERTTRSVNATWGI